MTHVLQVVLSLDPGGSERLVVDLCRRLDGRFRFTVCCLDHPGLWASLLRDRGIDVVALERRPGFHPSLAWRIARLARHCGAGVLHCHEYSPYVYGTIAQLVPPGLHVISTEHGRLSDARATIKRRIATRVIGQLPASVFAVCDELAGRLVQDGFPRTRVGVIRNGIDPGTPPAPGQRAAARRALGLGESDLVIGTVGRLAPVKGFPTLLAAASRAAPSHPHVRIVVIGDGPERTRLTATAASLGLEGRLVLAGHRDDVRELLPAFDLFVNSSTYEGISLTILEAMAAALPVIATRVGGTPEVVADGDTGVLVPARAANELGRAMAALLADEPRRRAMGRAARGRVIESFHVDRMVASYAGCYDALSRA